MPDEPTGTTGEPESNGSARSGAEAAVITATRAAGWLARTSWRVTRSLPGGELAERQLVRLERAVVGEVRRRIETTDTTPGFAWRSLGPGALDPSVDRAQLGDHELVTLIRPLNGQTEPLRAGMAELLNRSTNADPRRNREYLYATILRQLVPDEARILAALVDGAPRVCVDVVARGPLGGSGRTVLANASTVGKDAGVAVAEYVPTYLTRLYRLGLVDLGDEDTDLAERYDILLTDQLVRAAERSTRHGRFGGVRVVRKTVVISALGLGFWSECDPTSRQNN